MVSPKQRLNSFGYFRNAANVTLPYALTGGLGYSARPRVLELVVEIAG